MEIISVTVGVPVASLDRSLPWYQRVLDLTDPDLRPVDGMAEFAVGGIRLQLFEPAGGVVRHEDAGTGVVVRLGVPDVAFERGRLRDLGVGPGDMVDIPGVIEFFDVTDPDGTTLSFYTVHEQGREHGQ